MTITIELSEVDHRLLTVLCDGILFRTVEEVVEELIDHAGQGVYRPGAWERDWLIQVFGEAFTELLEPGDPHGRPNCDSIFQRPKPLAKGGGQ